MWYVETLHAMGALFSAAGVVLGVIGLGLFRSPHFIGTIMSGLFGVAVSAPAWYIVHQAIN